jgi:hypothetical protein
MSERENLPKYQNPPVVEVVCGILFKPLDKLLAPHLGMLKSPGTAFDTCPLVLENSSLDPFCPERQHVSGDRRSRRPGCEVLP